MGNKYETAYALFADKSKRVITHTKLSEGNLDSTGIYTDRLTEEAILNKAYYVVVAHNHPSGYIQPSPSDFEIAQRAIDSLKSVTRYLLDFVIVDHLNSFSFVKEGFFKDGVLRSPYVNNGNTYKEKDIHKTDYGTNRKMPTYLNDD
jgi:DNA repair protein RadC